MVKTEHLQHTM